MSSAHRSEKQVLVIVVTAEVVYDVWSTVRTPRYAEQNTCSHALIRVFFRNKIHDPKSRLTQITRVIVLLWPRSESA